jgi:hypothetical protein
MNISDLSNKFYNLVTKNASFPVTEKVEPLVKNFIDSIKETQEFNGVYYASNVEVQSAQDFVKVMFLLNVSNDPKVYDALQANYQQRLGIVQREFSKILQSYFGDFNWIISFQDIPIAKPNFWTKKIK